MKVKDLMTNDVKTCQPQDSLNVAAKLMWDGDIGSVVVVNEGRRVLGMITDRDITMSALLQRRPLGEIFVKDAMSSGAWCCSQSTEVDEAEKVMAQHQVHRLPITGADGRLSGILSVNDLAQAADHRPGVSAKDVTTTLRAVSAPRHLLLTAR